MDPTPDDIRAMTCTTRQTPRGWLAVSVAYAPIQIGVEASSEEDARAAFSAAAEAWAVLRERPVPFDE